MDEAIFGATVFQDQGIQVYAHEAASRLIAERCQRCLGEPHRRARRRDHGRDPRAASGAALQRLAAARGRRPATRFLDERRRRAWKHRGLGPRIGRALCGRPGELRPDPRNPGRQSRRMDLGAAAAIPHSSAPGDSGARVGRIPGRPERRGRLPGRARTPHPAGLRRRREPAGGAANRRRARVPPLGALRLGPSAQRAPCLRRAGATRAAG